MTRLNLTLADYVVDKFCKELMKGASPKTSIGWGEARRALGTVADDIVVEHIKSKSLPEWIDLIRRAKRIDAHERRVVWPDGAECQ